MIEIIFGVIVMLLALAIAEFVARRSHFSIATVRKFGHVGMMLLMVLVALFTGRIGVIVTGVVIAIILLVLRFLHPLKSISDRAKGSLGEVFFPLGAALAALLTDSISHLITAIVVLGLADTAAYVAGTRLQSLRLPFHKSVAGSLGFFVVAAVILLFITPPLPALAIAAFLMIIEFVGPLGLDNLFIPVVAVLLLRFIA